MKNHITIILIAFALTTQAQVRYSTLKQIWNIRSNASAGVAPTPASFTGKTIVCWNTADSVAYFKEGSSVVAKYAFYAYSSSQKDIYSKVPTGTATYGAPKYLYYIKTSSVSGNIPPPADNTAPNLLFWNTADSTIYRFIAGVITPIYRIHGFSVDTYNYHYIATNGHDTTGNGTIGSPWRSLYKACQSVTTAGKTIYVAAGTYRETNQCNLAVGVNLKGAGATSIIKFNIVISRVSGTVAGSLNLVSSAQGTNGNQSISNIKFIGTGTPHGTIGIFIARRSNVLIHDVTVFDFDYNGITFIGGTTQFNIPTTYATGNKIYNCTVSKCGTGGDLTYTLWNNAGLLCWAGQDGLECYNNTLSNVDRAQGYNDNIVSVGYANKGCKYHDNISVKPDNDGRAWNFHIESWELEGGFEIYNNTFTGGDCALDIAGHYSHKGSYAYTYSFHDNYCAPNVAYGDNYHPTNAITVEGLLQQYVYIYNNHFYKHPQPIAIEGTSWGASNTNNIFVYKNLMEQSGINNSGYYGNIMYLGATVTGSTLSNISIYNNTIQSDISRNTGIKINTGAGVSISNVIFKNNIVVNCTNATFMNVSNSGSISGLNVDYNCLYGNSNSNNPVFSGNSVTGYTFSNNIKLNPLFTATTNFHLQGGSPAIDAGVNVGIPYNGTAPDQGAFEKE